MGIKIFSENGEELSDKEFNASSSSHKFIEIDNNDQLNDILNKISIHDGEKDFTIACPISLKADSIEDFNVDDVTIIFTNNKYNPDNEESRKAFRDLIIKTNILYRNKNFVGEDVIIHEEIAEKNRSDELIAAAYKFIAFEYCDENGGIKDEYENLKLEKIHSRFGGKHVNDVIKEAKNAVCGGEYDIKKFNQVKEKSIYSGVDKFKATIDPQGYLVIQSVCENIGDENFKAGVKTNFRFEKYNVTEITQDNLRDLFTGDSDGKNSGLSLLGAIELAFEALKTIEKDNNGKLINPKSSEVFNAIFIGYGASLKLAPVMDRAAETPSATPSLASAPSEISSDIAI